MINTKNLLALCLGFGLTLSGVCNAGLVDKGGGLIYDNVRDITWLQNANYAAVDLNSGVQRDDRINAIISAVPVVDSHTLVPNDFQLDGGTDLYTGKMTWWGAMAWVSQLVINGASDWRLPSALNQDGSGPCGPTEGPCTGSELGHMYYSNLGGSGGNETGAQTSVDAVPVNFTDIPIWAWTDTETPAGTNAWVFIFSDGSQFDSFRKTQGFVGVWAVHDGDAAAISAIPVPAMGVVLAAMLVALGWRTRRQHAGSS